MAAMVLLGSAQTAVAAPPGATGWHGLGWDLPALQQTKSVDGIPDTTRKPSTVPPASAPTPTVVWPAAASSQTDLPATTAGAKMPAANRAGNMAVSITRGHGRDAKTGAFVATGAGTDSPSPHAAGKIKVDTIDHSIAEKARIPGTFLQLAPVLGDTTGPVSVDLDYRAFAGAYGADYGQRLKFMQYPACVLTSPDKPECHVATPVDFTNDAKDGHLIGEVALPATTPSPQANASTVLAAQPDPKGGGGDFTATDLTPVGSWTSGGSGGDFTYSYPIAAPAGLGGTAPAVSLNYSSGSVDGLTSATNNQASVIGDGWNLTGGGYIERSYKACAQDLGGNNGQTKTGDECWFNNNATLSFAHANGPLVKDKGAAAETWHPQGDDGSKVERLTGAANGAKDGEYWKVTTTDGTQYFFGLNHLPGWQTTKPETQSTWTVPVYGNNAGEPCNAATFAASSCQQAWRWNLDYVVDPHGNAISYYYQPETNSYAQNLNVTGTGTNYVRGGYLQRMEYGFNTHVADVYSHAPAQILFGNTERCLPSGTITCDPAQLTKDTTKSWPDVPLDQICAQGAKCTSTSPSFFSRKRFISITTQVTDGVAGWNTVNQWALGQSFPATGDGNSPALWLDTITQTGKAGGSITLPPTTFHPKTKSNRVDANSKYTALTRNRIDTVTNPQGGITTVNYTDPECVPGAAMPANPETNTMACYPTYWTPGGATDPVLDWFNKYKVTDVTETGGTALSQQVLTHYDYTGAAWHHDDNLLIDAKYRTWSQWRGYAKVTTTKGQAVSDKAGPPAVTQALFLQGMNGDTLPNGGTRTVSVPSTWGESVTDSKQLAGFAREKLTLLDGKVIADTLNDPWISGATGTDTDGVQSFYSGTGTTRTRTWIAATNLWRTTRKITTFGGHGLPVTVEDDGSVTKNQSGVDIADPTLATCTTTTYAQSIPAQGVDLGLLNYPSRVQKVAGICNATNPAGSGNIISDNESLYDHQALGVEPTTGNATEVDDLDTWTPGGSEQFQAPSVTTAYDVYGRPTATANALGLTIAVGYTPATGGPVTQVTTTAPPISGSNPTKLTSTKYFDPISNAITGEVDTSGLRTDATYDALGRLTAVWPPGHDKSANQPAVTTYAFTISSTGANSVTTNTLLANGQYTATYTLVDGMGRTVQTQAPSPSDQAGRVVTDTQFDSQGRASTTHNPYWNSAAPSNTLLVVQDNAVPNSTVTTFDSAGRGIKSAYDLYGTEQWSTTTSYDGDRVTTIPPAGGTATTVITNGLDQKTQLLQYKDTTHTAPGAPADTTTYTYTPSGKPASITDSTGKNTWTYTYDLHDRKASSTDPDTGTTALTYDTIGELATSTDARGKRLVYTYDNLGRKTTEHDGTVTGPTLASWTYDTVTPGLPTGSTRFVSGQAYTSQVTAYDTAGRTTGIKATIPAVDTGLAGTYQFSSRYDPYTGAIQSTNSPGKGGLPAESIDRIYDTLGNPTELYANGNHLVSQTKYNAYGQVLRTNDADPTDPNQVSVTNTYSDGTNRLATTIAERATTTNYQIANRTYTYDQAGDIAKIADTAQGAAADVQCFSHDYLQRLTEAWTPTSADCTAAPTVSGLGGAAAYWTSWTFDLTGNRRTQVQHAAGGDTTSTSTYPDDGHAQPHALQGVSTTSPTGATQTGYSYDEAGNTKTMGPTGSAQTFTYDVEGHVASATDAAGKVSTYIYDADGNRIITKDPTGETLTVGDLELFVPAGDTHAVGKRVYSHNGQPVAELDATTGLTWLLNDNQGTTYATVNAGNLAVSKRWQDPYGTTRGAAASTWPDKHGYLGGYQNTTGLTHLGARDYDPTQGRFTSVDPVLDAKKPQQLNGYAYGFGDPVSNPDPTGLEPLNSECVGSDMAACESYYYGNWDGPVLQRINVTAAIDWHWHSAALGALGELGLRESERYYHPHGASKSSWKDLVGVVANIAVFAGCEVVTAPETAGLSTVGCGALAGAVGGGAQAAVDGDNILAGIGEGGLLGLLEGLGGLAAKGLAGKVAGKVGGDTPGEVGGEPAADGPSICPNSFVGSTPVLMADGTSKPIEQVRVGDQITNSEPDSDKTQQHVVTALHVTDTDRDFVDVYIDTFAGLTSIKTTAHHLFWDVTTHTWTNATDLNFGDQLDTPGNGHVAVSFVRRYTGVVRTYNLTVDTVHTYYVEAGTTPILVHNTDGCEPFPNTMSGTLDQELATAQRLGVAPAVAGSAGFESALSSGTIKWAVLQDGSLVVIPKFANGVEISHSVLSGGASVRAAGEAEVAGSAKAGYFGLDINYHSGHFQPSSGSLQIGIDAFAAAGVHF
jgi:RHS repeat-associated protein